jgi:ABC-2 type transport system permease protein
VFILLGIISGALDLTLGTLVKPSQIGILYDVRPIPIQFLGCVYYPWSALQHIQWVQISTLADPLTYLTEGNRAALTSQVPHMSILAVRSISIAQALTLSAAASVLLRKRVQA